MEFERPNLNGEIVLGGKLKPHGTIFLRSCKNFIKMNPTSYLFKEDALSAPKIRLIITFSYQIQM